MLPERAVSELLSAGPEYLRIRGTRSGIDILQPLHERSRVTHRNYSRALLAKQLRNARRVVIGRLGNYRKGSSFCVASLFNQIPRNRLAYRDRRGSISAYRLFPERHNASGQACISIRAHIRVIQHIRYECLSRSLVNMAYTCVDQEKKLWLHLDELLILRY